MKPGFKPSLLQICKLYRYVTLSSSRVAEFCASNAMQVLGGAGWGCTS
jgi:hypothetical protein